MKLLIVAVGQRVPDWAQTAWDDYAKRFPFELKVELKAVKTEPRGSKTLETLYAAERERNEAVGDAVAPPVGKGDGEHQRREKRADEGVVPGEGHG